MLISLLKKNPVFRKAEKVKDLYFQKLDAILSKLNCQEVVLASLSANDSSVLQALAHIVEKIGQVQQRHEWHQRELERRVAGLEDAVAAIRRTLDASARAEQGVGGAHRPVEVESRNDGSSIPLRARP